MTVSLREDGSASKTDSLLVTIKARAAKRLGVVNDLLDLVFFFRHEKESLKCLLMFVWTSQTYEADF